MSACRRARRRNGPSCRPAGRRLAQGGVAQDRQDDDLEFACEEVVNHYNHLPYLTGAADPRPGRLLPPEKEQGTFLDLGEVIGDIGPCKLL